MYRNSDSSIWICPYEFATQQQTCVSVSASQLWLSLTQLPDCTAAKNFHSNSDAILDLLWLVCISSLLSNAAKPCFCKSTQVAAAELLFIMHEGSHSHRLCQMRMHLSGEASHCTSSVASCNRQSDDPYMVHDVQSADQVKLKDCTSSGSHGHCGQVCHLPYSHPSSGWSFIACVLTMCRAGATMDHERMDLPSQQGPASKLFQFTAQQSASTSAAAARPHPPQNFSWPGGSASPPQRSLQPIPASRSAPSRSGTHGHASPSNSGARRSTSSRDPAQPNTTNFSNNMQAGEAAPARRRPSRDFSGLRGSESPPRPSQAQQPPSVSTDDNLNPHLPGKASAKAQIPDQTTAATAPQQIPAVRWVAIFGY